MVNQLIKLIGLSWAIAVLAGLHWHSNAVSFCVGLGSICFLTYVDRYVWMMISLHGTKAIKEMESNNASDKSK